MLFEADLLNPYWNIIMENLKEVSSILEPTPQFRATSSQRSTTNYGMKKSIRNHFIIALLGSCGIAVWIIMFSVGMLIDSTPYRTTLSTNFTLYKFIMTILAFTPTNIAILCIVSAFTGGCASLLVVSKAEKVLDFTKQGDDNKTDSHIYMAENPFSSMLRGVLVFFAFLAGIFVTSSTAISSPTPQAYTQAAGVVSMLSFIVGYDPTLFKTLISIGEKVKGKN